MSVALDAVKMKSDRTRAFWHVWDLVFAGVDLETGCFVVCKTPDFRSQVILEVGLESVQNVTTVLPKKKEGRFDVILLEDTDDIPLPPGADQKVPVKKLQAKRYSFLAGNKGEALKWRSTILKAKKQEGDPNVYLSRRKTRAARRGIMLSPNLLNTAKETPVATPAPSTPNTASPVGDNTTNNNNNENSNSGEEEKSMDSEEVRRQKEEMQWQHTVTEAMGPLPVAKDKRAALMINTPSEIRLPTQMALELQRSGVIPQSFNTFVKQSSTRVQVTPQAKTIYLLPFEYSAAPGRPSLASIQAFLSAFFQSLKVVILDGKDLETRYVRRRGLDKIRNESQILVDDLMIVASRQMPADALFMWVITGCDIYPRARLPLPYSVSGFARIGVFSFHVPSVKDLSDEELSKLADYKGKEDEDEEVECKEQPVDRSGFRFPSPPETAMPKRRMSLPAATPSPSASSNNIFSSAASPRGAPVESTNNKIQRSTTTAGGNGGLFSSLPTRSQNPYARRVSAMNAARPSSSLSLDSIPKAASSQPTDGQSTTTTVVATDSPRTPHSMDAAVLKALAEFSLEELEADRGDYQKALKRACKTMARETLRFFGLSYCIYYQCGMNPTRVKSVKKEDFVPFHLCPVCLHKMVHVFSYSKEKAIPTASEEAGEVPQNDMLAVAVSDFDLIQRYQALLRFFRFARWLDEKKWIEDRLAALHVDAKDGKENGTPLWTV